MNHGHTQLFFCTIGTGREEQDVAWILEGKDRLEITRRQYEIKAVTSIEKTNTRAYFRPFVAQELSRTTALYSPALVVFDDEEADYFLGGKGQTNEHPGKTISLKRLARSKGLSGFSNLEELIDIMGIARKTEIHSAVRRVELIRECYHCLRDRNLSWTGKIHEKMDTGRQKISEIFGDRRRTFNPKDKSAPLDSSPKGCLAELWDGIATTLGFIFLAYIVFLILALIIHVIDGLINGF
jgi:hypothetical protein